MWPWYVSELHALLSYYPFILGPFWVPALNKCYITKILFSTSIIGKKSLSQKIYFLEQKKYAHYLSSATLASHEAFVGLWYLSFHADIFCGFYFTFQLWVPSMYECPKIRQKYLSTVTLIAQPPHIGWTIQANTLSTHPLNCHNM